jgi:hypothetical protein
MSTPVPTAGQAFLAMLESDLLTSASGPLLTFLTAFGAAAGDPTKIALAWVGLQGSLIGSLPALEAALSQQIAAALTAKLQEAITKIKAA